MSEKGKKPAPSSGEKEPSNGVAQMQIMTEAIKKELRHQKLYKNYTVNPFKKVHILAPKPNAFDDEEGLNEDTYGAGAHFVELFKRANLEPTKKFIFPQTENQEYGWISKPVMEVDRADQRLYHPKNSSDVTQYMQAYWRMKEQTQNLGGGGGKQKGDKPAA